MNCEVLVVGAGPAGATCARQLARLGHEVVLADQQADARFRLGETCGPGLRRVLDRECGLALPGHVQRPLEGIRSAWGGAGLDRRSFPFWHAEHGLVLDRAAFDRWLVHAAAAAGVTVVRGCRVRGGERAGRGWRLGAVVDGAERRLTADFVVEATGRAARSVTQPGLSRLSADALVCLSVELPEPGEGQHDVLVEACRVGWWYSALTPQGSRLVALFTDADLVGPAAGRRRWFEMLLDETEHIRRLVPALPAGPRLPACGARTSIRSVLLRGAAISIGDAAYFLDPLSGTGIERSVTDGVEVAEPVSHAVRSGDPGRLREFALRKAGSFTRALELRRRYYGAVEQWADDPFWGRRTAPANW